jgi:UDP-N-acetylglucosamine 2-epimerase (non-hydrolysing)
MHKCVIHLIAAARPNFMKVAPVYHALKKEPWCELSLVHTGQHYDENMSDNFIKELGLPLPRYNLEVGSGTHAEQTSGVMVAYEKLCYENAPNWIIVVGDVNSTMACALVGAKLCISVAHLEAGLRSRDRTMPEEINRIVTDAVANLLWTPSSDADENLLAEGVSQERIERVGNIMIDSYELLQNKIENDNTREIYGFKPSSYGVVTLHRPANVDDPRTLSLLVNQILSSAKEIPLIFTVHPRTRKMLLEYDLLRSIQNAPGLSMVEPLSYIKFMNLVSKAKLVITDSGGLQEETTYLNIPCLTVRDTTERPITIMQGTNKLVRPENLFNNVKEVSRGKWPVGKKPELWDGNTAKRIAESMKAKCGAIV